MINGGTGPVLAFAEILYKMSTQLDVPFLTLNAWIGLWMAFYMLVAAVVDLNRIIKYATRFTDEIFSFLISTIFIINAMGSVSIISYTTTIFRLWGPTHIYRYLYSYWTAVRSSGYLLLLCREPQVPR